MRDRRLVAGGLAAALLVTVPGSLLAQRALFTGLEYRSLSFDPGLGTSSVSQLAVPIGVLIPLGPRLTVDIGTRFATTTRTNPGNTSFTLSGLTDLQARAVYQVVPNYVMFTASTNVPTGKVELTCEEELQVASLIASDLIPFPVSNYGSGFNVTSGVAVAVPVAGFAVGAGGSYRYSGEYSPLACSDSTYRAGGEVKLRFGVDRVVGQGRVSLGFTYSDFSKDEFGGSEALSPGRRFITQASANIPVGNLTISLYAWNLRRTMGLVEINSDSIPGQNVLTLGAGAAISLGRNLLRPSIEYRRHTEGRADAPETRDPAGTLLSFGLRYQMALSERFSLLPSFRFDTGNIASGGGDVGYSGFNAAISLRAGW
jgi:hypothetical protein